MKILQQDRVVYWRKIMNSSRFSGVKFLITLVTVLSFSDVSAQALKVAPYICDSAILQQETPIIVKGKANPNSEVVVTFDKIKVKTKAGGNGDWRVVLPSKKASFNPLTLDICSQKEQIRLHNILIGDVWFAGGQSNMVFNVASLVPQERARLVTEANYPNVRLYYRRTVISAGMRVDHKDDRKWVSAKDSSVLSWSAIAYLFARGLYNHNNIPIGIISCAHGGSPAEAWISPETFRNDTVLQQSISVRNKGFDSLSQKTLSLYQNPSSLYLNMLSVFEGMPVKGVIWYQGEANGRFAQYYQHVFSSLIDDWRVFFNNKKLPFIFAQLSSFRVSNDPTNDDWAKLRWAQYQVAREKDNCFMVVTSDYGDAKDIHPKDKAPVAERFVDVALQNIYGEKKLSFIKLPEFASIKDGVVEVVFDMPNGDLIAKSDIDVVVGGEGESYQKCDATLNDNILTIDARTINKPIVVRYAWSNINSLALYHNNGTPVSPFELKIRNNE